MTDLIDELLAVLKPAIKSRRSARQALEKYWADKIALVWTTVDVHRAANEKETVLSETEARELLIELHTHYNPQYGIQWRDLSELILNSGKGRDMKKQELHRFLHRNVLAIEPPLKR
ncbi:MAG TPA: hypothetical protein VI454_14730 [Verrucomicrobiae bacterium]|jgi:hypothetical protein